MELNDFSKPKYFNKEHFSLEKFPSVIAFCDRDDTTYIKNGAEESYSYKFHDKVVYRVKKTENRWEIVELDGEKAIKVSTGTSLGAVLSHALTFGPGDIHKQATNTNILIPVDIDSKDQAMAIMYYLGGYPASFAPKKSELMIIVEKFLDSKLDFLIYSHVPIEYIPWLQDELKKAEIIGQSSNRRIWTFKM